MIYAMIGHRLLALMKTRFSASNLPPLGSLRRFPLILCLCVCLSHCTSFGPRVIRAERTNFNLAVQETEDSQLLLNLVRLKYHDTPVFLELTSITSQSTLEAGLGNGDPLAEIAQPPSLVWKPGGVLGASSQPTVSYTPLHGERYARQLLAPLKIETLMLLYRSGWPLENLLRLCVQRLNNVENAVHSPGPNPEKASGSEAFARLVDLIAKLNRGGHLDLVYETMPDQASSSRIVLHVSPEAPRQQAADLVKQLGLIAGQKHYPVSYALVEHRGSPQLDHLEIETRSLHGILSYLSHAVVVPPSHEKEGIVSVTRTLDGGVFDWGKATHHLLQVRSSASKPSRASTKVQYRGTWFYIADSDSVSKSTFSLLTQLVSLQSGDTSGISPVLTLPVSR